MKLCRATWTTASTIGLCGLLCYSQTVWNFTTPAADEEIAKHFQYYSTPERFDTRIQHFVRAHRGQMPDHIAISKSAVTPFYNNTPPSTPLPTNIPVRLLSAVMNSQVVIVGVPLNSRSLPIPDQTFLFTEYVVRVDRVFYGASSAVSPSRSIVISKAGGTTMVGSVRIDAVEPDFDALQMDQPYVFCLNESDSTGTYAATGFGTYLIQNGLAIHSSKTEAARTVAPPMEAAEFLAATQAAAERKAALARR